MNGLDLFALIVLLVIAASVVGAAIVLARLPGQIARKRGHPQAEAIGIAGWLGMLGAGIFWPLALIWAFTKPRVRVPAVADLQDRLAALEAQLAAGQGTGQGIGQGIGTGAAQ